MSSVKSTSQIATQFRTASKAISSYSSKVASLSTAAWELIAAEASDRLFLFSPLCELFEKLSSVSSASASAHDRIYQNLRDIVERNAVIVRITGEYKSAQKSLESVRQKIRDLENQTAVSSGRKDFNQAKVDAQMAKLQIGKKEALLKMREVTVGLISERRKFQKFAFRKIREAFGILGEAMTVATDDELRIVMKLIEGLRSAREGVALKDTSVEGIELEAVAGEPQADAVLSGPVGGRTGQESGEVEEVVSLKTDAPMRVEIFDVPEMVPKKTEKRTGFFGFEEAELEKPAGAFFDLETDGIEPTALRQEEEKTETTEQRTTKSILDDV
jgi:hypothetical protein